jgi:hypothetical protein
VSAGGGDVGDLGLTWANRMHIFYSRRVVDIHDGKPKWEGLDEKSELMEEGEESGDDRKRKRRNGTE